MKFEPTLLQGAYVIELEPMTDERGFFARSFCQREFAQQGLNKTFVQANVAASSDSGILRGLHFQISPHAEVKLIRCTRGAIFDVIVDLRPDSPTYCKWDSFRLTADNYKTLYVPEHFAHGYQALEPNSEVTYMVSEFYEPAYERGVRWDDPSFGIKWPIPNPILSPKDRDRPDFRP